MSRVVFTGAGASKSFGLPLTGDLLGLILQGIKEATLFEGQNNPKWCKRSRRALSNYLTRLLPGIELIDPETMPMVTEVFSMVDYAINAGELLPIGTIADHREFRHLLILAITDIIMSDFEVDWDRNDPTEGRQADVFNAMVRYLRATPKGPINLISTNYDITLESRLYYPFQDSNIAKQVDLGYDWRSVAGKVQTRASKPKLRVLKLHGSLDTLHCPYCGHVYFNPYGTIAWQAFRIDSDEDNMCECNDRDILGVHIVSMSLVRDIRDANLLSVWRSALETLRTANEWVIFGYSMPQEDLAIRSLLIRAYHGAGKKKPKITIVQHGDKAKPAYMSLFPNAKYFDQGLEQYLIKKGFLSDTSQSSKVIKKAK